jgi:putative transposase
VFESKEQFELWCLRNEVSSAAKLIIEQIRSSNPSRSVRSGKANMSGRYPSRKMGVTIQFESGKNELPHIRILDEDDDDAIEFYDQPNRLKLTYEGVNGRRITAFHTPDFFVIRRNSAGWEENKTEQSLIELESHNPNRYCRDDAGKWRSMAGENYVAQIGFFYYRVISSKEINWTFQRNLEFLEDYFRVNAPDVSSAARESVVSAISLDVGISLEELFNRTSSQASRDDIFMLIAHEHVYVDLYSVSLPEFKYVRVFPNKETSLAYQFVTYSDSSTRIYDVPYVILKPREYVLWDRKSWQIVNVGERFVSLLSEVNELVKLPISGANKLIEEGLIVRNLLPASSERKLALDHPDVKGRLLTAAPKDLSIANYRIGLVRTYLAGQPLPSEIGVPERTVRHWAAKYLKAEDAYGCGYIGLIPQPNSGNTSPRLPDSSRQLMDEFIQSKYEDLKQRRRRAIHDQYTLACNEKHIEPASYRTFCKAIKLRPQTIQKEKRVGSRAAYSESEFYWELEMTTPRHGERPFHIVHIDHTLADVECRCSITGRNMGRPWTSLMTDANSRSILAKYTTYDPPSHRTLMMLVRECVRRFKRFPQIVIVDGAFEFSCTYFETLVAMFEATKKVRPSAKARFGSVIERLFGTANSQFFHNLEGNTQIMKNVRQVTRSVDPRNQAIWTLERLDAMFTEWAYEVYDTTEHPALGQSPREALRQGIELYGARDFKVIPYDETFLMLTMPPTSRGRSKVGTGGVRINHIRYWSDAFNDERVKGKRIPTRLDPWNAGVIYAFVRERWVEARSDYYAVFRNRTEREMMLASEELRRRYRLHSSRSTITAKRLAEFLQSIEAEEVLLHQRLADLAARQIVVSSGILPSSYIYGIGNNTFQDKGADVHDHQQLDNNASTSDDQVIVSQIYKTTL